MRLLAVVVLIAWGLAPALPVAAQPSDCRFVLGFATLRDLVGVAKVGSCLEDERFNPENGNAEQRTSGGLLVWRKVDNFTAFTDGSTTWVNGPNGLQSRPNGERFSWERDPVQPARPDAPPSPVPVSSPPAPSPPATPTATPPSRPPSGTPIPPGQALPRVTPPTAMPASAPAPSATGDTLNCDDFQTQQDAQEALRADPADPNNLDNNRDGIACESLPGPRDTRPVPR